MRSVQWYLLLKAVLIGFPFRMTRIAGVYAVAGWLDRPVLMAPLVFWGLRDTFQLYLFCGFTHCDALRQMMLGWIACVLITSPIAMMVLGFMGEMEFCRFRRARVHRRNVMVGGSRQAEAHRCTRWIFIWLLVMDLRVLFGSILFFVRDEKLRQLEQWGKRSVPMRSIVPQGFGKDLRLWEMMREVASALFFGMPL